MDNLDYAPENLRLAYKLDIYAQQPSSRNYIYIDAANGDVILVINRIHTVDVIGTAETRYSGTQNITTDFTGAVYRLRESGRGNGIQTFDMNNSNLFGNAVDFVDNDNFWNNVNADQDEVATDAHWGAEMTYDYFLNIHGRNSIDNNGFILRNIVHYSTNLGVAFWNGLWATYGDGDGIDETPYTAIDVVGHEFTHGLIDFTANFISQNEPGALNESFSDIFGNLIEGYGKGAINWRGGEDFTTNGLGIRNMADPKEFMDPDTYLGTWWYPIIDCDFWPPSTFLNCQCPPVPINDNCGVHINSGVQNYWFYLLSEGGSGTNDNGDNYSLHGIGADNSADIAYRNLTVYLNSASQYADARQGSIWATEDLYGTDSFEWCENIRAWNAVGVYDALTVPPYDFTNYTATTSAIWEPGNNPFITNGDVTEVSIEQTLTIPAGINVTIKNMSFGFGPDAEVILERGSPGIKGAKLTLDNTVFSSFDNCGELELMWSGIQVLGHPGESQLPLATTQQAHLRIVNNSLIANAHVGVKLTKSGTSFDFFNYTGGIVQAENSEFRNNIFATVFAPYSFGFGNLSYFKGCTFETTQDDLNDPSQKPSAHVFMSGVQRIHFQGNTFRNTTSNPFTSTNAGNRGIGISSQNAIYKVEPLNGVPNTFQELNYGIQAFASNPLNTLTVNGSEFIDNKSGISLNGIDYATITSNNFIVGPYSTPFLIPDGAPYGFYLSGCTGFKVENNQFTALPFVDKTLIGSIVLNSGSLPNVIYRNTYENLLVSCLAQGNNRGAAPGQGPPGGGLQIKCNDFTNLRVALPSSFGWDIAVTFQTTPGPGIAEFQGTCIDPTTPAGNRFYLSDCIIGDDNIHLGQFALDIVYSHHTDFITTPQPNCFNLVQVELNSCFSINGECPSKLVSECINLIPHVLSCYIEIDGFENQAAELSVLIDGSNTQFLISTVKQGNPGHILKALRDASPYLSDEVLIAAINSKPPLPPGVLQQRLIANSPFTDEVMDALDNIFVPNGVMNQINTVQTGISERTKLESEIAYYLSQREMIVSDIIRFYLNDTLPGAMDSVIAILKRENRPARREHLVAALIMEKEFTKAEQEITQLHPNGNLDNFCKVQSVLIELGKQGKDIKQMDALQEQTVRAVAADTAQKACAHAQAMLKAAFEENFREIIVLPTQNQNKMGYEPIEEKTITWLNENHTLINFPNPFSDYTTIEAYLPGNFKEGEIIIYDLLGIVIKKYTIEKGYNAVTVLKDDMPASGIYFYALKTEERILAKRKMIILK